VTACRAAFSKYFQKVAPAGALPRIVVSGSRQEALDDFAKGLSDTKYDRVLLLVDAEQGVADGDDAWSHLQRRDSWVRPHGARDDSAHLMVQCMESWFMADKEYLSTYFGQGFNADALPARREIELIPKNDVYAGLENATRGTKTKGEYHKTRHGFDILSGIDPEKVGRASPFAGQLHRSVQH
jgi:hypothetical protein